MSFPTTNGTSTVGFFNITHKPRVITASEIAKNEGISVRRARALCAGGRIPGAFRVGQSWGCLAPYRIEPPLDTGRRSATFRQKAIEGMRADAADLQAQVTELEDALYDARRIFCIRFPAIRPYFLTIMGGDYTELDAKEMILALGFAAAMLEAGDEP